MPRSTTIRRTKTTSGRFRVANPRNRPKGKDYLKNGGRTFWPGDVYDISSDKTDIDALLERGQIVRAD